MASCLHCGLEVGTASSGGAEFCCGGCRAAYDVVRGLGLDSYYQRRRLDAAQRPLRPDEDAAPVDHAGWVRTGGDGIHSLHLMVEGLHCAACVWLIEKVLGREPDVVSARLNMTTRRLVVRWRGEAARAGGLAAAVTALGYGLLPFDPALVASADEKGNRELLRAMAVAGFAAGNVMLLSVSVWAGHFQGMGPATRDLLHWVSALIALPAIAYAGVPFYRSALTALRAGRANMDVPISLAVILAAGMSLFETLNGGPHAYFDSAVTLLFFLLVGRYLDRRARGRARSAAERLLAMNATAITVVDRSGQRRTLAPAEVRQGMTVLVAVGERVAVDGRVVDGTGDLDNSLVTGETVPVVVGPGCRVFAGTLNLTGPLRVTVTAVGEDTLLGEIVRLMEAAEQGRAKYVALADRVARLYAPVVHGLALVTFLGWLAAGAAWQQALLTAVAVLIITCPCALALAVPVVQVIASGRLLRRGILIKSGTALERLASVERVVFDKTGTLTLGRPELTGKYADTDLRLAASLAAASKHPLARALAAAAPAPGVREVPGRGLSLDTPEGEVRLGSRAWCGIADDGSDSGPEMWLTGPGRDPLCFAFTDRLRTDAAAVVETLRHMGMEVSILSGDRAATVSAVAERVGISHWRAGCSPEEKCAELAAAGGKVLMVGDGLNDAPALAAAHASLSPATAIDVSQTAADVVFQGDLLAPVVEAIAVARRADSLVRQNFALAFLYNGVTIPLAVLEVVTPLLAAVAMSASSLVVIGNALRLGRR